MLGNISNLVPDFVLCQRESGLYMKLQLQGTISNALSTMWYLYVISWEMYDGQQNG